MDHRKVIELYQSGIKVSSIAKEMEVSTAAVNYVLVKNNIREKSDKYVSKIDLKMSETILNLHSQGKTPTEISKFVNITAQGVRSFLNKNEIKPNIPKKIDNSRPCTVCGTVFSPTYNDGKNKAKYKTCSPECRSKAISISKIKYNEEQIQQIVELKKQNVPNNVIVEKTGIDLNKVKEVVKENELFLSPEIRQQNAYEAKLQKDPEAMIKMREKHMNLTHEEFERILSLIEKEVKEGKGSVGGLCLKYGLNPNSVVKRFHSDGKHNLISIQASTSEIEILNTIREWLPNTEIFHNDRVAIKPKELDVYIPSRKIGIEYCGLYWHNENSPTPRLRENHKNKMEKANKEGIRLITIFEDEWLERKEQIKNYLKSVLNKNKNNVFARKTEISIISKVEATYFLEKNHIQGSTRFDTAFGLFYEEELVAVMTGGKHHRQGHETTYVLSRLAFKDDFNVVGGASKLFKHLKEHARGLGYTIMISWSDNRWSEGNVYKKMGFTLEENMEPDYSYVFGNRRLSKQSCQKKHLLKKGAVGNTEREMAASLGYDRIWDCGKIRWALKL